MNDSWMSFRTLAQDQPQAVGVPATAPAPAQAVNPVGVPGTTSTPAGTGGSQSLPAQSSGGGFNPILMMVVVMGVFLLGSSTKLELLEAGFLAQGEEIVDLLVVCSFLRPNADKGRSDGLVFLKTTSRSIIRHSSKCSNQIFSQRGHSLLAGELSGCMGNPCSCED